MARKRRKKRKLEFSKLILVFETVLVAYVSHRVLGFVGRAIELDYTGSLPYLTTFISAVWAAYGTSVSFYQSKSGKENIKKLRSRRQFLIRIPTSDMRTTTATADNF